MDADAERIEQALGNLVRERAFDRFSRGDDARSGEGGGLGLAIARAIAEAHGGASGAGPRRHGRGADVCIALPR